MILDEISIIANILSMMVKFLIMIEISVFKTKYHYAILLGKACQIKFKNLIYNKFSKVNCMYKICKNDLSFIVRICLGILVERFFN